MTLQLFAFELFNQICMDSKMSKLEYGNGMCNQKNSVVDK
jgi:hypothetical protein